MSVVRTDVLRQTRESGIRLIRFFILGQAQRDHPRQEQFCTWT